MAGKLSVLRACFRVLKPGGLIAFLVIAGADSLRPQDFARLREDDIGPEHLDAGPGYLALMAAAGFGNAEIIDVSDQYYATCSAWIRERDAESAGLEPLWGKVRFEERQARQRQALKAIEEGVLQRYLITGLRP